MCIVTLHTCAFKKKKINIKNINIFIYKYSYINNNVNIIKMGWVVCGVACGDNRFGRRNSIILYFIYIHTDTTHLIFLLYSYECNSILYLTHILFFMLSDNR